MTYRRHTPTLSQAALTSSMRNAVTLWEIALAAPQVIAHRTHRMALAGSSPGARDRREMLRMSQEKAEAFSESLVGMGLRMWQAQTAMATSLLGRWWRQEQAWLSPTPWARMLPAVVATGLKPVHRTVTANVKRLGGAGRTRRRR